MGGLTILERFLLLAIIEVRAAEPSRRTTQAIARASGVKSHLVVRLLKDLEERRPPLLRRVHDADAGIVAWQVTAAAIDALDADPVDLDV